MEKIVLVGCPAQAAGVCGAHGTQQHRGLPLEAPFWPLCPVHQSYEEAALSLGYPTKLKRCSLVDAYNSAENRERPCEIFLGGGLSAKK